MSRTVYSVREQFLSFSAVQERCAEPRFRKASENMVLSTLLVESLIKDLPDPVILNLRSEAGIFLFSNFGELHSSFEFLKDLAAAGDGRPLPFQNSLHHSTLGFLSIQFGFRGPGASVVLASHSMVSARQIVELQMLERGLTSAIILRVEHYREERGMIPQEILPAEVSLNENRGAHAELLVAAAFKEKFF